jgi:hypothetical protein
MMGDARLSQVNSMISYAKKAPPNAQGRQELIFPGCDSGSVLGLYEKRRISRTREFQSRPRRSRLLVSYRGGKPAFKLYTTPSPK